MQLVEDFERSSSGRLSNIAATEESVFETSSENCETEEGSAVGGGRIEDVIRQFLEWTKALQNEVIGQVMATLARLQADLIAMLLRKHEQRNLEIGGSAKRPKNQPFGKYLIPVGRKMQETEEESAARSDRDGTDVFFTAARRNYSSAIRRLKQVLTECRNLPQNRKLHCLFERCEVKRTAAKVSATANQLGRRNPDFGAQFRESIPIIDSNGLYFCRYNKLYRTPAEMPIDGELQISLNSEDYNGHICGVSRVRSVGLVVLSAQKKPKFQIPAESERDEMEHASRPFSIYITAADSKKIMECEVQETESNPIALCSVTHDSLILVCKHGAVIELVATVFPHSKVKFTAGRTQFLHGEELEAFGLNACRTHALALYKKRGVMYYVNSGNCVLQRTSRIIWNTKKSLHYSQCAVTSHPIFIVLAQLEGPSAGVIKLFDLHGVELKCAGLDGCFFDMPPYHHSRLVLLENSNKRELKLVLKSRGSDDLQYLCIRSQHHGFALRKRIAKLRDRAVRFSDQPSNETVAVTLRVEKFLDMSRLKAAEYNLGRKVLVSFAENESAYFLLDDESKVSRFGKSAAETGGLVNLERAQTVHYCQQNSDFHEWVTGMAVLKKHVLLVCGNSMIMLLDADSPPFRARHCFSYAHFDVHRYSKRSFLFAMSDRRLVVASRDETKFYIISWSSQHVDWSVSVEHRLPQRLKTSFLYYDCKSKNFAVAVKRPKNPADKVLVLDRRFNETVSFSPECRAVTSCCLTCGKCIIAAENFNGSLLYYLYDVQHGLLLHVFDESPVKPRRFVGAANSDRDDQLLSFYEFGYIRNKGLFRLQLMDEP